MHDLHFRCCGDASTLYYVYSLYFLLISCVYTSSQSEKIVNAHIHHPPFTTEKLWSILVMFDSTKEIKTVLKLKANVILLAVIVGEKRFCQPSIGHVSSCPHSLRLEKGNTLIPFSHRGSYQQRISSSPL